MKPRRALGREADSALADRTTYIIPLSPPPPPPLVKNWRLRPRLVRLIVGSHLSIKKNTGYEPGDCVLSVTTFGLNWCNISREDKGDREGILHTHPIPKVIRLELCRSVHTECCEHEVINIRAVYLYSFSDFPTLILISTRSTSWSEFLC